MNIIDELGKSQEVAGQILFVEKHFRNTFLDKDSDITAVIVGGEEVAIAHRESFFTWCEVMKFPTAMVSIYTVRDDGYGQLVHDKLLSTVYKTFSERKEESHV
jgi:CTP:phosphocholine cytidylyltransferase-like protein